mmetsp:Transcript_11254/g.28429  ORF Transcript_11254/g.28429 Transcript_11254/m.28429 type:complete len:200 (-) Transcript_11254:60-659(-)
MWMVSAPNVTCAVARTFPLCSPSAAARGCSGSRVRLPVRSFSAPSRSDFSAPSDRDSRSSIGSHSRSTSSSSPPPGDSGEPGEPAAGSEPPSACMDVQKRRPATGPPSAPKTPSARALNVKETSPTCAGGLGFSSSRFSRSSAARSSDWRSGGWMPSSSSVESSSSRSAIAALTSLKEVQSFCVKPSSHGTPSAIVNRE